MAMQGFTQKIVQMMKSEKLFASQGGPIILSQIENEYKLESKAFGATGHSNTSWAANMVVELGTGVPWVMCKEDDAPDPVIQKELRTCRRTLPLPVVLHGLQGFKNFWRKPIVVAWKIIACFAAFEALLQLFLLGKRVEGPISPAGNRPIYKANGVAGCAVTMITYLILWWFGMFNFIFCIFLFIKVRVCEHRRM